MQININFRKNKNKQTTFAYNNHRLSSLLLKILTACSSVRTGKLQKNIV